MLDKFDTVIEKMMDSIEHSVHFLYLFWKNNPIYFLCSLFYYIICSALLGGTIKGCLIIFVVYAVSLIIGFSSLGEKILRLLNRVRPLETKRETEYLQPLFEEVYINAKDNNKELGKIEICVIDNMTVNAIALGRKTIAVTKGAMETFTEDELKAVIAHEVAHIAHGDTIASLFSQVFFLIFQGIFSFISQMNEPRRWTFLCIWYENSWFRVYKVKRLSFSALHGLVYTHPSTAANLPCLPRSPTFLQGPNFLRPACP